VHIACMTCTLLPSVACAVERHVTPMECNNLISCSGLEECSACVAMTFPRWVSRLYAATNGYKLHVVRALLSSIPLGNDPRNRSSVNRPRYVHGSRRGVVRPYPRSRSSQGSRTAARLAVLAITWLALALPGCLPHDAPAPAPASAAVSPAAAGRDGGALGRVLAGGNAHTCALVGGGVQCWGANSTGQLATNTTLQSAVPLVIAGLTSGVRAIAAGPMHNCALVHGGVQCWGYNRYGLLGNNSTEQSPVPVPVVGLGSGVQAVTPGHRHTCALVNGGAWCWGGNASGDLGNNSTEDSRVPVPVAPWTF
jgi:Regulator of chromosome condensation (RCC1) repeat